MGHDGVYVECVWSVCTSLSMVCRSWEKRLNRRPAPHSRLTSSEGGLCRPCETPCLSNKIHLSPFLYVNTQSSPLPTPSSLSLPPSLYSTYPWVWRRRRRWGRVARHAAAWHADPSRPSETPPPLPLHEGLGPAAPPHTCPRSATATATPKQHREQRGREGSEDKGGGGRD